MGAATGRPAIGRLLIANRGEIAVRIARTTRRLGIGTVGVYSDADADALHVDQMDIAVALGGTTAAESYLDIDLVLDAALRTGCDAVHPGYGFLAENATFAGAVEEAGLIWVGPTPEQITVLGDKILAKRAAVEAGVPTTELIEVTDGPLPTVTFPALVKAAAGGGGRGMRIVDTADDLAGAIAAARREAEAAFGDPTVFIEPYLARGRHVEVQIIGDSHGNVVHLGDRDCSVQRRNQKVVEEAPAPGLAPALRDALRAGAVALARHVGYRNAGTVEFLVGAEGTVTFLEVNTRLQVEHPVTEAITGVDLVELQLRVAAGEPLGFDQSEVSFDGHAIEVRLVAEDPAQGWIPSAGTIEEFRWPHGIRVDTGVERGSKVATEYDSLLAKVIAHGRTRDDARATLLDGLRETALVGCATNLASTIAVLDEADFAAANIHTGYFEDHPEVLRPSTLAAEHADRDSAAPSAAFADPGSASDALLCAAVLADERNWRRLDTCWGFAPAGWRNLTTVGQRARFQGTGPEWTAAVPVELVGDGQVRRLLIGEWPTPGPDGLLGDDLRRSVAVRSTWIDDDTIAVEVDGIRRQVRIELLEAALVPLDLSEAGAHVLVSSVGAVAAWRRQARFDAADTASGGAGPVAPLPGTVTEVRVAAGDVVAEGAALVVIEAMKMEHTIRASAEVTIDEVLVEPGSRVDAGQLLVTFAEGPEDPAG